MKKITLLLCVALLSSFTAMAQFPEGFETAVPPTGWASFIGTNGAGTTYNWTTSAPAASGLQAAFVRYENSGSVNEDWLVTPQFTPSAATSVLTFQQRQAFQTLYNSTYSIRVSTASQDTHADFTDIETYDESTFTYTAFTSKYIDLSAYIGTPIYVAFIMTNDNGDSWSIDDVDLINCPPVSNLAVSNITATGAQFDWTESLNATAWNIELVDITGAGTATGTATSSGVTNPFNITGLTPSNDYEYYVQADCGIDGTSTWVGPFAFSTTVACLEPSALSVANVTDNSAELSWTENGSATAWYIVVDAAGSGTPTGTGFSVTTNPYDTSTQGTLPASSALEFYVRADCGVDGTSAWVGPFAFTTACAPFYAPYTQDFENGGLIPDCWAYGGDEDWLFNTAGPNHVGIGGTLSGSTASGNYYAVMDDSDPTSTNGSITSPFVDVSGLTIPTLIFYEISNNEGNLNATLTVEVYDGAVWNTVGIYNANTIAGAWEQKIVDLSGLTFTGPAQVRFSVADSGAFWDDIAIDDVTFDEFPACAIPSGLTATMITDNSADLGWTENGTATLWDIELVDVTGAGTATGTATATGVTSPYAATGLAQNNDYAFYVRADCGGGTTSDWVGPFAFTTLETCPTPSGLNATTITETTADLGWTENGTATAWNIELVDITAGGVVTGTATAFGVTNPYAATGLVGDNSYEFYVQADCGVDGASAWAGPFSFATPYVADCSNGIFKDSGGTSGDYSHSENITYTISPDVMGGVVTVYFTAFSTESFSTSSSCYDYLTIYDGPDATATTIDPPGGGTIWCWDESFPPAIGTGNLEGMTITSTHPSGALTFVFKSDDSVVKAGWEAIITCSVPGAPANDDCADAIALSVGTPVAGDTSTATDSGVAPGACAPTGGDSDIWYSFVANAVMATEGAKFDTTADHVLVYADCSSTTETYCLASGESTAPLTDGTTYFVRVYNSGVAKVQGPISITLQEASLSTQDFDNGLAFSYYPNPVKNTLTLNAQQAITNVAVFNMLGQEVIITAPNAVSNDVDMSSLQSGAYFVQVTIGTTVETVRVIKN